MARGYIIGNVAIDDQEQYKVYVSAAAEAIKLHGAKALVRGGRCEVLEGAAGERQVVLEFESYEKAREYYYSSEYQSAMRHRLGVAIANVILVEGV